MGSLSGMKGLRQDVVGARLWESHPRRREGEGRKATLGNGTEIAATGKRTLTPQDHQKHTEHSLPAPRIFYPSREANFPPARPLAHWLPSASGRGLRMGTLTSLHFQSRDTASSEKVLRHGDGGLQAGKPLACF